MSSVIGGSKCGRVCGVIAAIAAIFTFGYIYHLEQRLTSLEAGIIWEKCSLLPDKTPTSVAHSVKQRGEKKAYLFHSLIQGVGSYFLDVIQFIMNELLNEMNQRKWIEHHRPHYENPVKASLEEYGSTSVEEHGSLAMEKDIRRGDEETPQSAPSSATLFVGGEYRNAKAGLSKGSDSSEELRIFKSGTGPFHPSSTVLSSGVVSNRVKDSERVVSFSQLANVTLPKLSDFEKETWGREAKRSDLEFSCFSIPNLSEGVATPLLEADPSQKIKWFRVSNQIDDGESSGEGKSERDSQKGDVVMESKHSDGAEVHVNGDDVKIHAADGWAGSINILQSMFDKKIEGIQKDLERISNYPNILSKNSPTALSQEDALSREEVVDLIDTRLARIKNDIVKDIVQQLKEVKPDLKPQVQDAKDSPEQYVSGKSQSGRQRPSAGNEKTTDLNLMTRAMRFGRTPDDVRRSELESALEYDDETWRRDRHSHFDSALDSGDEGSMFKWKDGWNFDLPRGRNEKRANKDRYAVFPYLDRPKPWQKCSDFVEFEFKHNATLIASETTGTDDSDSKDSNVNATDTSRSDDSHTLLHQQVAQSLLDRQESSFMSCYNTTMHEEDGERFQRTLDEIQVLESKGKALAVVDLQQNCTSGGERQSNVNSTSVKDDPSSRCEVIGESVNDSEGENVQGPETSAKIPRIIHQTWKSSAVPKKFLQFIETYAHLPGFEYKFWDDRDLKALARRILKQRYFNKFLSVSGVMQADIGRLLMLYEYGGLYVDMDVELLERETNQEESRWRSPSRLELFLRGADRSGFGVVIGEENEVHTVLLENRSKQPHMLSNAVLLGQKKHPFWLHVMDSIFKKGCVGGGDDMYYLPSEEIHDPVECTGPRIIDKLASDFSKKHHAKRILRMDHQWGSPRIAMWNTGHMKEKCSDIDILLNDVKVEAEFSEKRKRWQERYQNIDTSRNRKSIAFLRSKQLKSGSELVESARYGATRATNSIVPRYHHPVSGSPMPRVDGGIPVETPFSLSESSSEASSVDASNIFAKSFGSWSKYQGNSKKKERMKKQQTCDTLAQVLYNEEALISEKTLFVHHWQCSWCREDDDLNETVDMREIIGGKIRVDKYRKEESDAKCDEKSINHYVLPENPTHEDLPRENPDQDRLDFARKESTRLRLLMDDESNLSQGWRDALAGWNPEAV